MSPMATENCPDFSWHRPCAVLKADRQLAHESLIIHVTPGMRGGDSSRGDTISELVSLKMTVPAGRAGSPPF